MDLKQRLERLEKRAGIGAQRFCPKCGRDLWVKPTHKYVAHWADDPQPEAEPQCECLGPQRTFTVTFEESDLPGQEHPSERSSVPWTP